MKYIPAPIREKDTADNFKWLFIADKEIVRDKSHNGTCSDSGVMWNYSFTTGDNKIILTTKVKEDDYCSYDNSIKNMVSKIRRANKYGNSNVVIDYDYRCNENKQRMECKITVAFYHVDGQEP